MSGGSYDYICFKIEDIELRDKHLVPERAAFQSLLKLVAKAMHDIEWVDSSDYGQGSEIEAINKCFEFLQADADKIAKAAAYDNLKEILKNYLK